MVVFSQKITIAQFEQIVHKYEKLVYTICYSFTKDSAQAQDLTQDTFFCAYTHIDDCEHGQYKPWLARIAANKAKDYLKSAYYKKVHLNLNEEMPESNAYIHQQDETPLELIITKEQTQMLHKLVNSLNEPYLFVSQLYFLHNFSINDISVRLNRPKKTVQTQIYRARYIIAEKLEKGGARQNE